MSWPFSGRQQSFAQARPGQPSQVHTSLKQELGTRSARAVRSNVQSAPPPVRALPVLQQLSADCLTTAFHAMLLAGFQRCSATLMPLQFLVASALPIFLQRQP
ncbi:unnamed protein product [Polarella glacialis]|uniref:Uncharacterized protein n=1 Tax=Polarella glacialis TaxID=89957 RepID=A0A813DLM3_POLGL|nr:unnamed protein product [Polarella glacialis]